jgi:tetratricopeptide (TPR) repeat protein
MVVPGLVLAFLSPSGAAGQEFPDLARQAQQALDSDCVPDAIDLYRRATALRPDWAEGWWHLGTLLFDNGSLVEARDAFQRFVASEPMAGPGFGMLGVCEFRLTHYEEAAAALEHARQLGLGPNQDFRRRFLWTDGVVQSALGRPALALMLLERAANEAAAEHPGAAARELLGDAELVDAIGIAALRLRSLVTDVPPEKAPLVRQAGVAEALFMLKDWASAEDEFRRLAATYPNQPGVHYMCGMFQLKVHPENAIAEFQNEIGLSPKEVDARVQIALLDLTTGDFDQGRKYAAEAVKLQPGNFAAHVIFSRLCLGAGDAKQAEAEAEIAVKLAPESPEAHQALAQCFARLGRTHDAQTERAESERLQAITARRDGAGAP